MRLGLGLTIVALACSEQLCQTATPTLAADPPPSTQCDITLDVTDKDPAGVNIRAQANGAAIARLRAKDQFVTVTVVGVQDGWFKISDAWRYDYHQGQPWTTSRLFRGTGWIHSSRTGVSLTPRGEPNAARLRGSPGGSDVQAPLSDDGASVAEA